MFQLTAARRRLHQYSFTAGTRHDVSTHSRPKAAAIGQVELLTWSLSFNSQPPEGGCAAAAVISMSIMLFQLTAARRRLHALGFVLVNNAGVSTHSRPKAAAHDQQNILLNIDVSTHSRPKAAAGGIDPQITGTLVSTHSRPKAAAMPVVAA